MKPFNLFAAIILAILLALQVGCEPKTSKEGPAGYIDDTVLTTKVKTALLAEPELKSSEISVETFDGTVQLSGSVSSHANMQKAVAIAREVEGVKNVKNDMHLKLLQ